jgi:Rieske Fe-S protein
VDHEGTHEGAQGPGRTTRRTLLGAAGAASMATVLAACGSGSSDAPEAGSAAPGPTPTKGPTSASPTESTATALGPTSDIPVGGGKVFAEHEVVVTQPAAGTFKAFTAMCTHMQCLVNRVANGQIICPCHDSRYSITDGSVLFGPAPHALAARSIKVSKGKISLA